MKNNSLKGILLLTVMIAGSLTAWFVFNKPTGKHHKAATAMLNQLFQNKHRMARKQEIEFNFEKAYKTGKGTYTLKNLSIRPPNLPNGLNIDRMTVTRLDTKHEVPQYFDIAFTGIHFTKDTLPDPRMRIGLSQLGLSELLVNVTVSKNLDPDTKVLTGSLNIELHKLYSLQSKLELREFNPKLIPLLVRTPGGNTRDIQILIDAIKIKSVALKFSDTGILKKISQLMSPAMFNTIKTSLNKQIASETNPVFKQAIQAFIDFLNKKGDLKVSIAPNHAVKLETLFSTTPRDMGKLLNMTFRTE